MKRSDQRAGGLKKKRGPSERSKPLKKGGGILTQISNKIARCPDRKDVFSPNVFAKNMTDDLWQRQQKKTPTSDNVSTPAAPLPPEPPCECMCPLEQSAGGTSKTEWTTEVVDDSAVSKPRKKTRTPHSGNWETMSGVCFFCQWVDDCPPREDARFFCQWVDAYPPCEDAWRGAMLCHLDGDHDEYDFDNFCDVDYD